MPRIARATESKFPIDETLKSSYQWDDLQDVSDGEAWVRVRGLKTVSLAANTPTIALSGETCRQIIEQYYGGIKPPFLKLNLYFSIKKKAIVISLERQSPNPYLVKQTPGCKWNYNAISASNFLRSAPLKAHLGKTYEVIEEKIENYGLCYVIYLSNPLRERKKSDKAN